MSQPDAKLVINPHFRFQFEAAQDCYVLLYPEGMVKLNPSAAEILLLANGQHTAGEICQQLMAKFPQAGDLSADVYEFIADARGKNWLQDA